MGSYYSRSLPTIRIPSPELRGTSDWSRDACGQHMPVRTKVQTEPSGKGVRGEHNATAVPPPIETTGIVEAECDGLGSDGVFGRGLGLGC